MSSATPISPIQDINIRQDPDPSTLQSIFEQILAALYASEQDLEESIASQNYTAFQNNMIILESIFEKIDISRLPSQLQETANRLAPLIQGLGHATYPPANPAGLSFMLGQSVAYYEDMITQLNG